MADYAWEKIIVPDPSWSTTTSTPNKILLLTPPPLLQQPPNRDDDHAYHQQQRHATAASNPTNRSPPQLACEGGQGTFFTAASRPPRSYRYADAAAATTTTTAFGVFHGTSPSTGAYIDDGRAPRQAYGDDAHGHPAYGDDAHGHHAYGTLIRAPRGPPETPHAHLQPPPAMTDAFLDGILGRGYAPEPLVPAGCTSVDEMVERLRETLTLETTETRCSHIQTTLELAPATRFVLPLSDADREAFETQMAKMHPTLHGEVDVADGQTRRILGASDVIERQSDNPFVQDIVAKHIVAAIGDTDASAWVVRDFSKSNEGWKIRYSCAKSMQEFARTAGRSLPRIMVPESSQDHDPLRQCKSRDERGGAKWGAVR
jgi:hypothetical protein